MYSLRGRKESDTAVTFTFTPGVSVTVSHSGGLCGTWGSRIRTRISQLSYVVDDQGLHFSWQ